MSATNSPRNKQRPPRKKACNNCTKSKVRCSLEKPVCSRCQSSGRTCEYPTSALGQSSLSTEVNFGIDPDASYSSGSVLANPNLNSVSDVSIPTTWSRPSQLQRGTVGDWQDKNKLDFTNINLAPSTNAEDIRDRWLRPYIPPPLGQNEVPKVYHPSTLQYISRVLSTYPRCMLRNGNIPPIIHHAQVERGGIPHALANCYTLVRMWEQAVPGSEEMVVKTLEKEMERLAEEVSPRCDNMSTPS